MTDRPEKALSGSVASNLRHEPEARGPGATLGTMASSPVALLSTASALVVGVFALSLNQEGR